MTHNQIVSPSPYDFHNRFECPGCGWKGEREELTYLHEWTTVLGCPVCHNNKLDTYLKENYNER